MNRRAHCAIGVCLLLVAACSKGVPAGGMRFQIESARWETALENDSSLGGGRYEVKPGTLLLVVTTIVAKKESDAPKLSSATIEAVAEDGSRYPATGVSMGDMNVWIMGGFSSTLAAENKFQFAFSVPESYRGKGFHLYVAKVDIGKIPA